VWAALETTIKLAGKGRCQGATLQAGVVVKIKHMSKPKKQPEES
jgi:hypothetical protein